MDLLLDAVTAHLDALVDGLLGDAAPALEHLGSLFGDLASALIQLTPALKDFLPGFQNALAPAFGLFRQFAARAVAGFGRQQQRDGRSQNCSDHKPSDQASSVISCHRTSV